MKFTKILPVIAVTALLTGCNLFKSGPSFKASKYKNESTCKDVYEAYEDGLEKAGVPTTPDPVDFSLKGAFQYLVKEEVKLNNKVRASSNIKEAVEFVSEFDKDSVVAHTNIKGSLDYESVSGYNAIKYTMKQNAKNESYAQETTKGEGYELTIANFSEGYYDAEDHANATLYTSFFSQTMNMSSFTMMSLLSPTSYESMTDEQKAQYKFYKDGNLLTMVNDVEDSMSSEVVEATLKGQAILQYKIEGKKLSYFIQSGQTVEYKYLQASGEHLAGEVDTNDVQMSVKGTFDFSEVKLTMKDVNKLDAYNGTLTVNSMFNLNLGM
ncbi:MAG: hypothetical protein J5511_02935 [Bacilli bacterium]|nr:hypothetical protein [Bacilli bacterium]